MTVALFDWDANAYRAAFAAQRLVRHVTVHGVDRTYSFDSAKLMHEWRLENEFTMEDISIQEEVLVKKAGYAIKVAKSQLLRASSFLHATSSELYLTGKDNFRHLLYDQYKANRIRSKPVFLPDVIDYSVKKLGAKVIDGMEADDMLSIRATELDAEGRDWVIISPDKDLLTVAGNHYNPFTEVYQTVDPLEAHYNFYCQLLTGDTADNIPGLLGIGKVRAGRLLEECHDDVEMWNVCKDAYADKGKGEEEMIRNGRLLHMMRHRTDLWEPPQ